MKIWIDGDSCPKAALTLILDAAAGLGFSISVVADRELPLLKGRNAEFIAVPHGSKAADDEMVRRVQSGDAALTRDYLLGMRLLEKGVRVFNDKGMIWEKNRLAERIREAEIAQAMRAGGFTDRGLRESGSHNPGKLASALRRLSVELS